MESFIDDAPLWTQFFTRELSFTWRDG